MWPWRLSWRCARRRLGNQADIWGFWPGAWLRHPDGRGRRGGWGPEDHLPRVSDSFCLDYHAFNLFPLLRLLSSFLPGFPRYLQQSLDILATRVPCNYALFFSTLFLSILPWHTTPLFLRFPPHTHRRPLPLPFTPESFFCLSCSISLSFHHHPPQQSMKNRCHTTLSVFCDFNAKSQITARLCAVVATCILMPPIGVCTCRHIFLTVVINCAKIYHLNKSFYGTAFFFLLLLACLVWMGGAC